MITAQSLPQVIGSMRVYHHWHAQSEQYTGADSLVTLIEAGWSIGLIARVEEHWPSGTRRVLIYHFELTQDGDVQFVAVIHNPYVDRLIYHFGIHVVPMARRIAQPHLKKSVLSVFRPITQPSPAQT